MQIRKGYGLVCAAAGTGALDVDTTSSTGLVSKDRLTNTIAGLGAITGSGAANRLAYWTGASTLSYNNELGYTPSTSFILNMFKAGMEVTYGTSTVIGDFNGDGNGTKITVDDASQIINLNGTVTGGPWNGTPIDLSTYVSGNLGVSHLNSGTSASSTTFWRGDGTWATPIAGTGTVTSVATGLGLSGGTITTTGTIVLDTASSVVLSRQRAANEYQPIGSYLKVDGSVTGATSTRQIFTNGISTGSGGITSQAGTNLNIVAAATQSIDVDVQSGLAHMLISDAGSFEIGDPLGATCGIYGDAVTGTIYMPAIGGVDIGGTITTATWNGGTIGIGYGGTGLTSYTQGDLIYSSAANTLAKLAKDANATRYLSNTGTSNNPAWSQINLANGVTGNLPVTNLNGGTSASSTTFWRGDGTWVTPTAGVTTMGTIGATPNANGASISGSTLTLQPADGSFGGIVTTGTQTFGGKKTIDAGSTVAPQLYVTSSAASTRAGINNATNTGFGLYIGGTIKFSNAVVNVYGGSNPEYLIYNDAAAAAPFCIDGNTNNVFFGNSATQATAIIHIKAGTSTANTAPLKLTSGTNLATAEAGAMEYNGTNIFFSPSTTRYTLAMYLDGSATLDFGNTAAQSSTDLTITVTGAAISDAVILGADNGSVLANSCYTSWVKAANTVSVRFNNYSAGAQDPASGTFKVKVIKN